MTESILPPTGFAATHDNVFHADDVFAAAALRLLQPDLEIRRSRDPQVLAGAALAFDVGGGQYDHHQRGGNGQRENGIPYAAFGLIWRDYGAQICGSAEVADAVDGLLVQAIDAGDNGVDLTAPLREDVQSVTLANAISWLNPSWQESQDFDSAYEEAVVVAQLLLRRAIVRAQGKIRARSVVQPAVEAAAQAKEPRILELDQFVPWQDAVLDLAPQALFVIFPSGGTWRCQAVPAQRNSFATRRPLPPAWAGLDGENLASLTGVLDATFAHKNGFICGAASREGALELARLALDAK